MARSELLTAVLAALLAIASHAQDTAPPKEPGSLSGVVTNALTGDPVLHAHVTLQPIGSAAEQTVLGALSDGEGKFSLTQIPAGRYAVSVEKTSFTPKLTPATSMLTFGNGEKKTGLQLALLPGGVITGRVLDSRGEPMENVRVGALAGSGGTTDEEGRYRIGGLPPGRQRVSAMMYSLPIPAEHRTDGSEELHHAVTFYQSSSTLEGAQWVQVRPGAETAGVDIRMVRVPVLKISGRVAGIPAGMQAALRLRLRNSYPNISGGGMTQPRADGTFDIWRVNPGKYWLQAGSVGGGEPLQSAAVAVDVESTSIENVELKVIPPETIRGVVRWDGEAPPDSSPAGSGAGGGDTKSAGLGQKRLNFSPTSGFSGFGGGMLDAVIADDGTFTLTARAARRVPAAVLGHPGLCEEHPCRLARQRGQNDRSVAGIRRRDGDHRAELGGRQPVGCRAQRRRPRTGGQRGLDGRRDVDDVPTDGDHRRRRPVQTDWSRSGNLRTGDAWRGRLARGDADTRRAGR